MDYAPIAIRGGKLAGRLHSRYGEPTADHRRQRDYLKSTLLRGSRLKFPFICRVGSFQKAKCRQESI